MLNLATPALHTISAMECFSCRSLQVSEYRRYARDEQNNRALPVATFLAAPFIWNFSGAFDGQIFREPYPGEYSGYASWPLRFVGLLPTAQSVQVVIGGSLRALERPNPMFCSSALVESLRSPSVSRLLYISGLEEHCWECSSPMH